MSMMSIMKTGLLSLLAVALAVSPAISAKHHRLHFRHAHAATLNLTKVNLHPVSELDRPEPTRAFASDRIPTERSFRLAPGGWTGSVGYHTSPGANAIPKADVNSAAATQYGAGDKTVGAAVGVRF